MHRRRLLRRVAVAAIGCTVIPTVSASAQSIGNELAAPQESLIEKTHAIEPPQAPSPLSVAMAPGPQSLCLTFIEAWGRA